MKFVKFLISKTFWYNLFIMVIVLILLILGTFYYLDLYTLHEESLTVPDLTGMNIEETSRIIEEKNLRYEIKDSVYVPEKPPLSVIEQNPKPLTNVKKDRKIYLTVNSDKPPKVKVPDLIDVSLRQAINILESYGLKPGELIYVPDPAQNAVLGMELNGKPLQPGKKVNKGTSIDLRLGEGNTAEDTPIPNVVGKTFEDVSFEIKANHLNIGATSFDPDVTDSNNAIIYKQRPLYRPKKRIPLGTPVDIWLTTYDKYLQMDREEPEEELQIDIEND